MSSANGHTNSTTERDWNAWLAAADTLGFRDQRHACGNPDCSTLTEALFCSESCREASEGPDHEDACDSEPPHATNEPSGQQNATSSILSGFSEGMPAALPEAPVSLNTVITIARRSVQVTLRGMTLAPVLQQMEDVLARFPVTTTPAQASAAPPQVQTPICDYHGPLKESTKAPGTWFCPAKMANGTYCHERWPAKGR
jgi:hypothetical protein